MLRQTGTVRTDAKVTKGIELSKQLAPIVEFKQPDECSALLGFDVQTPGCSYPRGLARSGHRGGCCELKVETVFVRKHGNKWRLARGLP